MIDDSQQPAGHSRIAAVVLIPVTLLLAALFIWLSQRLLIDEDEGFYLLAAKLIFRGRRLYHDVFFTQMPLTAWCYGFWMTVAPVTWSSARLLAALITTAIGCLLYWHVTRICRSWLAGCFAVFLFASSYYVLAWYAIVKTYSLSALLLFGAYLLVWNVSSRTGVFLGGVLLALAADTRLYLAALGPVFLVAIYTRRRRFPSLTSSYAWFFLGIVAGLAPLLFLLLSDPVTFVWDNLGFHMIRDQHGFIGNLHQKIGTLGRITGLLPTPEAHGLPYGLLVLANGIAVVMGSRAPRHRAWLASWAAATIIIVSSLPTPVFFQYYCVAVPFLVVGAVAFAWNYIHTRTGIAALAISGLVYAAPLRSDMTPYLSTIGGVPGIDVSGFDVPDIDTADRAFNWSLTTVSQVSREIDRRSAPGDQVMSFWPGYLLESQAEPVPGMESQFGLYIAHRLTPEQMKRYAILSKEGIEAAIARRVPCLVVIGNQETIAPTSMLRGMVDAAGYTPAWSLGHTSLYACKP